MSRTRKWPPSPSSPPVPDPRPDQTEGWLTRAKRSCSATTPIAGPCPSGDPGRSGAGAYKHVGLPPADLWRPHRPSYSQYVRGKETAASRAKAATLATLKHGLGKEKIGHLNRSRLIDGRLHDHELVSAVQRIAGNGTGDTRWKVPGVLDWSTGTYKPRGHDEGDDDALHRGSRRVPVPRRRPQPHRGGAAARRLARPLFPVVLLLEFRDRRQDARHRQLRPARGPPESAARPRASSTSFRGSPPWPGQDRSRTRGW